MHSDEKGWSKAGLHPMLGNMKPSDWGLSRKSIDMERGVKMGEADMLVNGKWLEKPRLYKQTTCIPRNNMGCMYLTSTKWDRGLISHFEVSTERKFFAKDLWENLWNISDNKKEALQTPLVSHNKCPTQDNDSKIDKKREQLKLRKLYPQQRENYWYHTGVQGWPWDGDDWSQDTKKYNDPGALLDDNWTNTSKPSHIDETTGIMEI